MTETTRQRRSDAGTVRVTTRDLGLFAWLVDMKAIYEADLPVLIEQLTGSRPGASTVRTLIARWQRAGVAQGQKLLASRPRIVRLTYDGARLMGEETWKETSEFSSYHQAEVARARLWLERTGSQIHGPVTHWRSERAIRQFIGTTFRSGARAIHVPDGEVTFQDGTKAGVEVERSVKGPERLRTILDRLTAAYPLVIYFVASSEIEQAVERAWKAYVRQLAEQGRTLRTELVLADLPEEVE